VAALRGFDFRDFDLPAQNGEALPKFDFRPARNVYSFCTYVLRNINTKTWKK
jgi:hypothetical protein